MSAVPLVSFSSVAAAVAKLTGNSCDHWRIVLGFSSGEESRIVSRTESSAITPTAMQASLIRSYGW